MDPYIGEIRLWPCTWAPVGWYFCLGQQLPIAQYTPLYSIIGVNFGGDGRTYFNLPNMTNSVAIGQGQGPGLTFRQYAEDGGGSTVALLLSEIASHNHTLNCQGAPTTSTASNTVLLANGATGGRGSTTKLYDAAPDGKTMLNAGTIGPAGGGAPHNNVQPALTVNFMICWDGIYPIKP